MTSHVAPGRLQLPRLSAGSLGLAGGLAAATILAQICYPLTSGSTLNALTVATVLLFAATTLVHVYRSRGPQDCLRLLVFAGALGYAAEALGVHSGFPFGSYSYTHTLGPEIAGVPAVIPAAWVMMSWPALCVGRRIGRPVLGGALALATWDVFLDPQMVHDGHWVWRASGPHLEGIPLVNYVGWLGVAILLVAGLNAALPARPTSDTVPVTLWLWTWLSSILANLAFFDRPVTALAGGLAMAVVGVPLMRTLRPQT